jgi:hypothetical protein
MAYNVLGINDGPSIFQTGAFNDFNEVPFHA